VRTVLHGDGDLMTPSLLAQRAVREPDRTCLIEAETDARITYRALYADSVHLAERLAALGVDADSSVATMLPHSIDTYRLWFGLAMLGAVEVPIGTRYRGRMLAHILEDSRATLLIIDAAHLPELRAALRDHSGAVLRTVVVRGAAPGDGQLEGLTVLGLAELGGDPRGDPAEAAVPPELPAASRIALVLYTSGTTGPSKGVLVPWGQVHATVTGAFPPGTLHADKVIYGPFPPNHVGGRLFACLGIEFGVPTVIRHVFSASAFWTDIERYRCTTAGLVAAMAAILFNAPPRDGEEGTSLEDVLMVPLIPEHREFESRFGVRVCTSFNMTEVSIPIVSGWSVEDWRSCGEVRSGPPGYQVRVVDEDDRPLGPGEVGELVCRTDRPWALNAGYHGRPQETTVAWRNGWFHTGDAFRYDDRGRFYFVDRAKDAIRRRGENVSSFEVEKELLDHEDVVLCAAIGVPSELGEEDIKAFVVTRPGSVLTEAELVAYVATKAASFMVPRYVELVDSLPVTDGTNRVKKAELRELERRRRAEASP